MKVKNNMKKINKTYMLISFAVGTLMLFVPNVFAAGDDPIAVVNNLSDFIFQITRVVGSIIVGYSLVQIGLSFTSHDASQRVNGFMFFVGGVIIMFAKEILNMIAG